MHSSRINGVRMAQGCWRLFGTPLRLSKWWRNASTLFSSAVDVRRAVQMLIATTGKWAGCRCVGCRNSHMSAHNKTSAMEHGCMRQTEPTQQSGHAPAGYDWQSRKLRIRRWKWHGYCIQNFMDRIFCDTAKGDGYDSEEPTDFFFSTQMGILLILLQDRRR